MNGTRRSKTYVAYRIARELGGWYLRRSFHAASLGAARLFPSIQKRGLGKPSVQEQWIAIRNRSVSLLCSNLVPAKEPPVLFMTIWTESSPVLNALESILSHAVRLRGVRTISLGCHMTFPACSYDPLGNRALDVPSEYCLTSYSGRACRNCVNGYKRYWSASPIEQASFGRYSQPDDLERATKLVESLSDERCKDYVFRDIHVGEHAYASTLRALGRGTLLSDPLHIWLLRRQLVAALVITQLTERALDEIRPRRVMAVHGIYVDHGTTCEVAKKEGYPIVVYTFPYRKNTIMLCHGDTYHKALVTEPTQLWESLDLTPEMSQRLDDYVISRQRGSQDSITYHLNPIEDKMALIGKLSLDETKPIVSMFTNVIWDAQIYHSYSAFLDLLDWLFQSVDYFINRTDVQWVIRIHPAEVKAWKKTEQPLAEELRCRYGELPPHIKVIPPESDISSYILAEMSKASIIYGTKMGLEIALRGVMVIVAGESFNRGKGFTYDVSSKEEYFSLLDRITTMPRNSVEIMEQARKYAYHFYFRRQMDFPFLTGFRPGDKYSLKLNFDSLDALLPGKDLNLDIICNGILDGTEFISETKSSI